MTDTGTCSNAVFNCKAGNYCPTNSSTVVNCLSCSEDMIYGQSCYCEDSKPIYNCQECAGNRCSKCLSQTFLQNDRCLDCPPYCDTCADTNSCITCTEGYEKNPQTGICELFCKSEDECLSIGEEFGEPATSMAQTCIPNCLVCFTTTTCEFCNPSGFISTLTGQCTSKCVNIQNGNYCDNGTAKPCDENLTTECKCGRADFCASCNQAGTQCKKCLPHMKFNKTGECDGCEDGFALEISQCIPCTDENCNVCPSKKNICTACKNNFMVQNGKCEKQCTTIANCTASQICDKICKTCTGNCATCKDAVDTCMTCKSGFILENQKCAACPSDCANCDGDKNDCKICKEGFFAKDKICNTCDGNTTEKCKCGNAANCATCDSSEIGKCGNCITDYKKADDGTCSACADGYLMVEMACKKCQQTCATCSQSIVKCTSCIDSHTMSINQTCEKNCTGELEDGNVCTAEVIVECGGNDQITACKCKDAANCLKCHSSDNKKCESCMTGYKFVNQQCDSCIDGYTAVGKLCFPQDDTLSTNLSGGAVAGIVIAVLIVVGGVAGGAFWYMKKSKVNQEIEKQNFSRQ
ncbi:Cysteine-rich membrane protein 2 [Spironucleus salmonicida]|uniref:Cysteine-rich membrane protein 2 n=1 Tax=Spironucleus salmonicida TaxID=348837 RepID=V6LI63_9EUKA|nr:Cysteine-rich membrane protein 2 [Spironucleus salmonicida]|eukprot:EST43401.1 Cysteine-rich membrane protein 2 [Spironucleus salmonicida]